MNIDMKRRSFLSVGAAAAASSALPGLARSALAAHRPSAKTWHLFHPPNRYVIRVNGPAVTSDCYGPDDGGGEERPSDRSMGVFEGAAMILVGPDRRPVSWHVATWHKPDPLALRIALSGVEVPLEVELAFEIDAAIGVLSRRTVLHHRGIGPD